ncbi:MAG: hypothetical protein DRH32_05755 [Deltaproteobacteria bacterium]|nr:MAG: hypothetical protein DRH32_05755 [Deltaproteobacteria bacterium]
MRSRGDRRAGPSWQATRVAMADLSYGQYRPSFCGKTGRYPWPAAFTRKCRLWMNISRGLLFEIMFNK